MSDIVEEEFKAPRKPLKRKISETDKMETESVESSGIESSVSDTLPKVHHRREINLQCSKCLLPGQVRVSPHQTREAR